MRKQLAIASSVFVFGVCTSVATPFSGAQSDSSMVDNHAVEQLTDAHLATVFGGGPLLDSTCDALFMAADVGYKVGSFFGLGGLIKAGAAIEGAAQAGGCER